MILPFSNIAALDACQKGVDFFGLRPWYHYIPADHMNGCEIKKFNLLPMAGDPSDVPLVLLAVVDDLLRIAAIVALAFVIVGAFQLVSSQGNPEDASKARNTIINALLGMTFAVVSAGFVNFLGNRLGG